MFGFDHSLLYWNSKRIYNNQYCQSVCIGDTENCSARKGHVADKMALSPTNTELTISTQAIWIVKLRKCFRWDTHPPKYLVIISWSSSIGRYTKIVISVNTKNVALFMCTTITPDTLYSWFQSKAISHPPPLNGGWMRLNLTPMKKNTFTCPQTPKIIYL